MQKKIFILLFIFCQMAGFSQNMVKGRILDSKTDEPLPFVAIGIDNSTFGTITNFQGEFELKIPDKFLNGQLKITSVEYETILIPVSENLNKPDLTIKMVYKEFTIETVDVNAKSKYPYKIIKTANTNIPINYILKPLNIKAQYKSEITENSNTVINEASVKIFDAKGYARNNSWTAFVERNYKFENVKTVQKVKTVGEGEHFIDDLLEADIVRTSCNVLDIHNLDNFEMKIEKELVYDNDSVWQIAYKCIKPDFVSTFDPNATEYSGVLFVTKKQFAIVKNELNVKAKNFNPAGRSFLAGTDSENKEYSDVTYNITVNYKKYNAKYALSAVNYNIQFAEFDKITKNKSLKNIKNTLTTTEINATNPEKIENRNYVLR